MLYIQVGTVLAVDVALCPYPLIRTRKTVQGVQVIDLPDDLINCNLVLADWAHALHHAGRLPTWRNELLNISALPAPTEAIFTGLPPALAQVERGAARALGIFTHAVHLVGLAADGRVWLQQRALTKATDPGLWDTLAGGLLGATDTLYDGMLRETYEEAGLLVSDLYDIQACGSIQQRRNVADGSLVEAVWTYRATVRKDATPHNLDGEVMAFNCVSVAELKTRILAGHVSYEAILAFKMAGVL